MTTLGSSALLAAALSAAAPGLAAELQVVEKLTVQGGLSVSTSPSANPVLLVSSVTSPGYVGIGTTSPSYIFDVYSPGATGARFTNPNGLSQILIRASGQGTDANEKAFRSQSGLLGLGKVTDNEGTYTPQLVIDNNGNVGIGTTSPLAVLHVAAAGSPNYTPTGEIASFVAGNSWSNTNGVVSIINPSTSQNASDRILFLQSNSSAGRLADFLANGATVLTLLASGNVGVGTGTPSSTLQVNGTATASKFATLQGTVAAGNTNTPLTGANDGTVAAYLLFTQIRENNQYFTLYLVTKQFNGNLALNSILIGAGSQYIIVSVSGTQLSIQSGASNPIDWTLTRLN